MKEFCDRMDVGKSQRAPFSFFGILRHFFKQNFFRPGLFSVNKVPVEIAGKSVTFFDDAEKLSDRQTNDVIVQGLEVVAGSVVGGVVQEQVHLVPKQVLHFPQHQVILSWTRKKFFLMMMMKKLLRTYGIESKKIERF